VKLTALDPALYRVSAPGCYTPVTDLAEAQGVMFLCPRCFAVKGSVAGVHSVMVWFRGRDVPPDETPAARWVVSGYDLNDLTLKPSIHIQTGCKWHGFVIAGDVTSVGG